ncbi:MAG TPA: UDP-N-acetylmuramoyl-L-alanine--D-glutamate ligase [Burkholderiaceae bacterium]|nr:UDP-N-acetylmuramoyl-L-alanine--D-glutamate ligase [Burkholderiaceae bacterium]
MRSLADTRVLVLGLGASGLAIARWCARCGAQVRVWDSRLGTAQSPPQAETLAASVPGAQRLVGALEPGALDGVQRVFKSPGLAPHDERIAPLLAAAAARGIAVEGELDLFAQALADLAQTRGYAPQVLAVTGTNGKTTTTAMTALLVERAGRRVATAGNIGPTMLETLAQALDAAAASSLPAAAADPLAEDEAAPDPNAALPEVWVLELSSFQLHGATGFEPAAAALLNISEDHLDWHGSLGAYIEAKARIFGTRTTLVVNRDDAAVQEVAQRIVTPPPAKTARKVRATRQPPRQVLAFGVTAPRHPGDFGIVVEGGMAWLVRALEADPTLRRRPGDEVELHIQRLMPVDALRVRGRHNAANALAALALASAIGCPLAPMLHGLREYGGEPHRVAFVAALDGIDAYDDSKGTNVGATVAALDGLGQERAPARLVVILGGDGKGQDFAPLGAPLVRHARAVALIGRDADRIQAQALAAGGVKSERFATLEAATRWAFAQARPGDAVLLSPACASLDMFRNYAHRAEVFVATVHELLHESGAAA